MSVSPLRDQVHPTRFRDLAVTVDFHCNSACTFCIVQEGMNNYRGVPLERFVAITEENLRSQKYDRVIFTGGEVTLEKSLFQFVEHARASGAYQHLRLQTNGRKLADPEFTRTLVDAGIDEFFVSLHGDTPALHDRITQRPGSFDELIAGLANLATQPVRRITPSCTHEMHDLEASSRSPSARVSEMSSNHSPMEDHADERDQIAPLPTAMPVLRAAPTTRAGHALGDQMQCRAHARVARRDARQLVSRTRSSSSSDEFLRFSAQKRSASTAMNIRLRKLCGAAWLGRQRSRRHRVPDRGARAASRTARRLA
jgi:uncharacterized Fe-S cluster-containing radical SAM superfamily protein